MILQGNLFDRRAKLAEYYLGISLWYEILGFPAAQVHMYAKAANDCDFELRKLAGLA